MIVRGKSGLPTWRLPFAAAASAIAAVAAHAQPIAASGAKAAPAAARAVQTVEEALAQDAGEYARLYGVTQDEARRRLGAQEASVAATDRLRETYRDRLAGISIEHQPDYRIVVLLTGAEPVPAQSVDAGGVLVPVIFRTGARATREQIVFAMRHYQPALRSALPRSRGMGLDPRTGELVLFVSARDAQEHGTEAIGEKVEAVSGVPVRVEISEPRDLSASVGGGSRVAGLDPANGRRYGCTTGFVVTDGSRRGVVTAAHCPDSLTYYADGEEIPLEFVGQWGARYQDVQIHLSSRAEWPHFYADRRQGALRALTGWRNRRSTRAGDVLCHWGESSGYSCSEVHLTDFAPAGELCGGPCDPVWTTVRGPSCKAGDSGGPVFSGTLAFGILKGANYGRAGSCSFYYYMSTDYLPDGWSLLHGP